MPYKDPEVRKAKHKEYSKKHYEKKKIEGDTKLKKSNQDKKKAWKDFKASLSCSLCGFSHPAAMDFHHVDPKTKVKGVHEWARMGSYKKAHEEVTRCIVLCANCHRILHYDLQNQKQSKRRKKKGAVAP
jgi:predicted HNH restriction endonuclease